MLTENSNAMPLAVHCPEPAQSSVRSAAGATLHAALYIALGAITLSPLLWVRVPPLGDYPSHLARMWILVHGAEIPELAAPRHLRASRHMANLVSAVCL
jgi:hypothetical protein